MSLIDDALKRAAQGSPVSGEKRPAQSPLPLPDRGRHLGRRTRAIVLVLAVAGLAFLVFALWPRRSGEMPGDPIPENRAAILPEATPEVERPSPAPTPEASRARANASEAFVGEVVVPPPPRVAVEVEPRAAAVAPTPPPVVDAFRPAPAPREAVSITRIDPPTPMIASASSSPAIVRNEETRAPSSPVIVRSEENRAPARPPSSRARTFVREATFASGGRVSLDGIVYSDDNPAALINGRVVTVGGFVDGREVLRIRPDRVELQDGSTILVLMLK